METPSISTVAPDGLLVICSFSANRCAGQASRRNNAHNTHFEREGIGKPRRRMSPVPIIITKYDKREVSFAWEQRSQISEQQIANNEQKTVVCLVRNANCR